MTEFVRETHPALDKWLYQFAESIVDGKPVSKKVLELILGLTGFDRGVVFLTGENNKLRLAVLLEIMDDQKAVESLARRSGTSASSPIEYEPDTTKLNWFRTAHQLKGSFILSYACVAIVRGKKQYGTLYLDSLTTKEPIKESATTCLFRLSRVMLEALLRDQKISVPTIAANDYLTRHSIRDLERERLLAVLKRHDWHVFSASQDMGTNVRTLYNQMERLEIEPPRSGTNTKREMTRNL